MRRALLDEAVPRPLARRLREQGVDVSPFPNQWKQFSNGALLDLVVAEGFDLLITSDKNMRHQQTIGDRALAVLVLPTNRLPDLLAMAGAIAVAVGKVQLGRFAVLPLPHGNRTMRKARPHP